MGFDIDAEIERFDGMVWHHVGTAWDLGWHPSRSKEMFAALSGDVEWCASEPRITDKPRGCPTNASATTLLAEGRQHIIANHFTVAELFAFARRRLDDECSYSHDLTSLLSIAATFGDPDRVRVVVVLCS